MADNQIGNHSEEPVTKQAPFVFFLFPIFVEPLFWRGESLCILKP